MVTASTSISRPNWNVYEAVELRRQEPRKIVSSCSGANEIVRCPCEAVVDDQITRRGKVRFRSQGVEHRALPGSWRAEDDEVAAVKAADPANQLLVRLLASDPFFGKLELVGGKGETPKPNTFSISLRNDPLLRVVGRPLADSLHQAAETIIAAPRLVKGTLHVAFACLIVRRIDQESERLEKCQEVRAIETGQ